MLFITWNFSYVFPFWLLHRGLSFSIACRLDYLPYGFKVGLFSRLGSVHNSELVDIFHDAVSCCVIYLYCHYDFKHLSFCAGWSGQTSKEKRGGKGGASPHSVILFSAACGTFDKLIEFLISLMSRHWRSLRPRLHKRAHLEVLDSRRVGRNENLSHNAIST